jgi:hypothetical protein
MAGRSWTVAATHPVCRRGQLTFTFRRMSGIHSAARVPR